MKIPKTRIKCTDNGKEMDVVVYSKTDERLVVVVGESRITLIKKNNQYVGNMAGLEFTSAGKETY